MIATNLHKLGCASSNDQAWKLVKLGGKAVVACRACKFVQTMGKATTACASAECGMHMRAQPVEDAKGNVIG
jgi:hypothetical protein